MFYLIQFDDAGWPFLRGPYPTGDMQKEAARSYSAAGKRTIYIDVGCDCALSVGRVLNVDGDRAKGTVL